MDSKVLDSKDLPRSSASQSTLQAGVKAYRSDLYIQCRKELSSF